MEVVARKMMKTAEKELGSFVPMDTRESTRLRLSGQSRE
jgi:hypothetical protein